MDSITWISLLLYANDMVLIAEFVDQVGVALHQLKVKTQQWGLTINVPKTTSCACVPKAKHHPSLPWPCKGRWWSGFLSSSI
jgi:hypothetical protein